MMWWWLERRGLVRKYTPMVAAPRDWNVALLNLSGNDVPLLEMEVSGEDHEVLELWIVMFDTEEFESFRKTFHQRSAAIKLHPGQEPVPCFCRLVTAKHTRAWPAAYAEFVWIND